MDKKEQERVTDTCIICGAQFSIDDMYYVEIPRRRGGEPIFIGNTCDFCNSKRYKVKKAMQMISNARNINPILLKRVWEQFPNASREKLDKALKRFKKK